MYIAQNTEEALVSDLGRLRVSETILRCLFLRFSTLEIEINDWMFAFKVAIAAVLDHDPVRIYVCRDGDVFVLSRALTHKRVEKFLEEFNRYLAPQLPPALPDTGLADLFEIGVDTQRLINICTAKITNYRITLRDKALANSQNLPPVDAEKTIESLNRDLLSSLAMRREMRREKTVMLVEDDVFTQKILNNALRGKYDLCSAEDGQGAIMTYASKAPDVLFLDIGLPDMDGLAVLERVFKIDPQAYVVMLSGNGSKENIMRAIELGAKGFIGKPFTKEKLAQYIEKSPHILNKAPKES